MFVRDFIRERIREHKAILEEDVASGGAVGNSAAEVGEFLAAWHVVMSTDEDFQTRETPLAALLSKVRNDQQRTNPSDESKLRAAFALLPVMRELVSLLDLADLLAGDGYRETRVKRVGCASVEGSVIADAAQAQSHEPALPSRPPLEQRPCRLTWPRRLRKARGAPEDLR